MFKNVATKIALFAFDTTTGAPKTGDAANLTAYVSKDYGTVTVLADTSATEMDATNAKGWYLFDVAQGESNADACLYTGKSSTANVSVVGQYIHTTPNRFTTLVIDAAGLADANTVKVGPTGSGTAQTARDVGASVLLSSGTGTGQLKLASGYVAMTWADVAAPTTTLNLSATTIATTQKVDVETIKTQAVTAAAGVTFPASVASPTNITAGVITTVTNLTNAPTSGDLTATMKTSVTTAATAATPAAASVTGSVGSVATGGITRASLAADTGLQSIRSNTAQAGASTTITLDASASAVTDFYKNALIILTGGTGAGQGRYCTAYNGTTKVATVSAWATNPDNTTTFAVMAADAIVGATAPTAAQVADEVQTRTIAAVTVVNGLAANVITAAATAADFTTEVTSGLSTLTAAGVRSAVGLASANLDTQLAAATTITAGAVRTAVGLASANLDTQLDALPTNAELATALGTADDAVLAAVAALSIPSAATVAAAVGATVVEGTTTIVQSLRLSNAALGGKASGLATTAPKYRDLADTKDRISATADADGNRSAVTRDLS